MTKVDTNLIGKNFNEGKDGHVDNFELVKINEGLRTHSIEIVGAQLREAMTAMTKVI
jgi:ketol-acid reductoisomerase